MRIKVTKKTNYIPRALADRQIHFIRGKAIHDETAYIRNGNLVARSAMKFYSKSIEKNMKRLPIKQNKNFIVINSIQSVKILNNYGAILIIFSHSLNKKIIHLFLNSQ